MTFPIQFVVTVPETHRNRLRLDIAVYWRNKVFDSPSLILERHLTRSIGPA